MAAPEIDRLRHDLAALHDEIESAAAATMRRWRSAIRREAFAASGENLARYLALRAADRTALQQRLRRHGLSTLGRSEGHVLASLRAIEATLSGQDAPGDVHLQFDAAKARLAANTTELFGPPPDDRSSRVLVTLAPEVGCDRTLVRELVALGANAVRINAARDDPATWRRMAETVRAAAPEVRVLVDLAGPKIRTAAVEPGRTPRLRPGDRLWIRRHARRAPTSAVAASCGCTLPAVLDAVRPGATLAIDDGKLWAEVETASDDGLLCRITRTKPGGMRLKADKGLNFPGTALPATSLTAADRGALAAIAPIADLVGYSFVQRARDIDDLVDALDALGDRGRRLGVIAKIETEQAFRNLPEIVVRAAGRVPFGVMVARGDLGVEVGFPRLSEVQEEILWLAEAAHVPVVWATDVLTSLLKNGTVARGEFTDAAMSARAECVMLNRGAHVAEAVRTLVDVLRRSERHLDKKTPQLARLDAWQAHLHDAAATVS